MKFLVIGDDATDDQLHEAIGHLRQRQQRAVIESTRQELADDVDELLEMLFERHRLPAV